MNLLKAISNKNLLILSLLLNPYLFAEEESLDAEKEEEKEIYIEEMVEEFEELNGFFDSFRDPKTNDIYLKIKKDQLDKEFIFFSHVINGVVAARKNKGSYLDNGVFKIEKDTENLRFIRVLTSFAFDEGTPLAKSKGTNISDSTFKVLPVSGKNEGEDEFLVNITSLLLSEDLTIIKPITPEGDFQSSRFNWGQVSPTKSRVLNVYNYEKNTDFEVEHVIESAPSYKYDGEDVADPRNVSIQVRYSFIEMPDNNFEPRIEDQSIGYFSDRVTNLSSKDVTPYMDLIGKWDLQKKDQDKELSEPIKPIVFWIENTTPLELRDYIKEGVLAWNIAFEEAGFKNAIQVKVQPDDASWDAGDIRYNVLRWTSSPNPPFGGYGPSFTNPRTGEIIGADIMLEWVYLTNRLNVDGIFNGSQIGNECFSASMIQEGMMFADSLNINDPKIIEQSIIRLTLHEVGHTLGLNHNFKGSFLHNIEDVHKPEITSKVGVTSSVMEYPAINLAPLGYEQGDYYDIVPGPYDKWAIKFGYTPNLTKEERRSILSESNKPEHMFANDSEDMRSAGYGIDPRAMINDLTNDPITYSAQRIELVNHAQKELPNKFSNKAKSWEEYRNAHKIILREHQRALEVVSRYIGGVYVERSNPQDPNRKEPYTPTPSEEQRRAMSVLSKHAFSSEAFPINASLLSKVQLERRMFDLRGEHEDPQMHKIILGIQNKVLDHILSAWTLSRITDTQLYGNDYSVYEVIDDLTEAIFLEDMNSEVSSIRRNLQTSYVRRLIGILAADYYDEFATAAAYSSLRDIEKLMKKSSSHEPTKAHRRLIHWIIDSGLNRAN
ncbi:MAG TPA: zinc-dependent metalloprotease [SAR86 cluster bacterium]|jgi:hypothetical protein|nr:zinc-dependent metalloprotease [SAR86 cluster bacterium]